MGGMIKPCKDCNGSGWKKDEEKVKVDKRSKEFRELKKNKEG